MKVILLKELQGKGGEGDVIEVARGFANNYLLPQGIAIVATKGNLKQLEQRKGNIAKREEKRIAEAQALRDVLDGARVAVEARVGDEGQLFGSVTTVQIAQALKNAFDVDIDRRRIETSAAIKTAGEHSVVVSLYRDIKAGVTLLVGIEDAQASPEPEAQAEESESIIAEAQDKEEGEPEPEAQAKSEAEAKEAAREETPAE